jgi:hypothetical protein
MTRNDILDVLAMAGAIVFVVVIAVVMALFGSGA